MPAEIVWPAEHGARRVGVLRFGPFFQQSASRDRYAGCGTIEDHGDHCVIGPLGGDLTATDWNDIGEACAAMGFNRARVERHGRLWEYDLTARPFKRKRI
jgi:hypothetical protein